ncbi:MAG: hypothetical protein J6T44_07595 [Prevotella sp.]|nr:hypothetical protein [Prevotella sp.]
MYKKNIITALLALVTLVGWAQEKPDTITINFQLASKTKGEMVGVLYPDFIALGTSPLQPVTDDNGQWTVKIPRLSHAPYSGLESGQDSGRGRRTH